MILFTDLADPKMTTHSTLKLNGPSQPDGLSIFNNPQRRRQPDKRQSRQQRIPPPLSKSIIQRLSRQRQQRTAKTAKNSIRGSSGGGVDGIGFNEVHHDGHKSEYETEADEHGAEDGYEPKDLLFGRPAVDEEAEGNAGGAGQDGGEAVFGFEV